MAKFEGSKSYLGNWWEFFFFDSDCVKPETFGISWQRKVKNIQTMASAAAAIEISSDIDTVDVAR